MVGLIDNCQVSVFLGYVNGRNGTLIDEQLYLPKERTEDLPRRREAGVLDEVTFKTEAQLGKEMRGTIAFPSDGGRAHCITTFIYYEVHVPCETHHDDNSYNFLKPTVR